MEAARIQIKVIDFKIKHSLFSFENPRCQSIKEFYKTLELKMFLMKLEDSYI